MTQLESARAGLITKEMKYCAEFEGIELEKLRKLVAEGKVVIPRNKLHNLKRPVAIGEQMTVKVNANIGTSVGYSSLEEELEKLEAALNTGADSVMVLSTWGNLSEMRKA